MTKKMCFLVLVFVIALATPIVAFASDETPAPPMGLVNHDSKFVPVSGNSSTEVCFPTPEDGTRNLTIRYFAVDSGTWVAIETTITGDTLCGTAKTPGTYALQGPDHLGNRSGALQWCLDNPQRGHLDHGWGTAVLFDFDADGELDQWATGCVIKFAAPGVQITVDH